MLDQILKLLQDQQQPQEQSGIAQQILSSRFQQEPSFHDVANATFTGALNKTYVNPQDLTNKRSDDMLTTLATLKKLTEPKNEFEGLVNTFQAMPDSDPRKQLLKARIDKETTVVDPFGMPVAGIDPVTGKPAYGTRRDALNGGLLPPSADPKPPNEYQGKSGLFASRMAEAEPVLNRLKDANTLTQKGLSNLPVLGNFAVSNDFQQLDQAKRNFINATLRQESGAAINQSEFDNAEKQYFPQPGDRPDVIAQKAQNRRIAIESMTRAAGPSYTKPDLGIVQPEQVNQNAPGRLIGTSGGKNIYQLPDGSHVMEQ